MMYISRLKLTDIRCFDQIEINFDSPGQSVLIMGDNGDGKSTVLRSLAMGLCDESSAAALFRELPGEFVRRRSNAKTAQKGACGTIEVDLSAVGGYTYRITTRIISLDTFERVTQYTGSEKRESTLFRIRGKHQKTLDQDSFPWNKIFVSGYGAGGRTVGTADFQHYLAVDAVYSLFSYDAPLQNPELVIRRFVDAARISPKRHAKKNLQAKKMLDKITELLADVLNLKESEAVHLERTGIEIRGPHSRTELGEAGDGYRATVTWILDLLAWWLLKEESDDPDNLDQISGIVLIDEIEQHLHPKWQISILPKLQKCFPNIQFIATTHSPLVASGATDVRVYQFADGDIAERDVFGWLAEDVYREMGLDTSRVPEFQQALNRYRVLDRRRQTNTLEPGDAKMLKQLEEQLHGLPRSDPAKLLQELNNMADVLKEERTNL